MMTITTEATIYAFTVAASVTSAVFWAAFLLGKLYARMERVETRVEDIAGRMDRAGEKMSDLANEVQKMPEKFLTRRDAYLWRGSRVEDQP